MQDANFMLAGSYGTAGQTLTAATATATQQNAAFDLLTTPGVPRRGLPVRLTASLAQAATAGAVVQASIDDSPDGTAWQQRYLFDPVTLTTTSTPFEAFGYIPGTAKRFVRGSLNMSGGNSPTVVYTMAPTVSFP